MQYYINTRNIICGDYGFKPKIMMQLPNSRSFVTRLAGLTLPCIQIAIQCSQDVPFRLLS